MEIQKDFKELLELFNAHNSLFRIKNLFQLALFDGKLMVIFPYVIDNTTICGKFSDYCRCSAINKNKKGLRYDAKTIL